MKVSHHRLASVSWRSVHFGDEYPELPEQSLHRSFNGPGIETDAELFSRLATALEFPSYFGENWNAVNECLKDLEWLPAPAYLLVITQARALWTDAPLSTGYLLESWLSAAEWWADRSVPFDLVFVV